MSFNRRIVFLIGFMGSGKSTLGKKIATMIDFDFIDLDEQIIKRTKMNIADYFEKFGEDAFRQIEKEELHKLLEHEDVIIATGGGTPCYYDNMEWMNQHGKTVYLKLPAKALVTRLTQNEVNTRPLLKGKSKEELLMYIDSTLKERAPFYEQAKIEFNGLQSNSKDLIKQILL